MRMKRYINNESTQHSAYLGIVLAYSLFSLISRFLIKENNHPEKCINHKGTVDELAQSECTCVTPTQVKRRNQHLSGSHHAAFTSSPSDQFVFKCCIHIVMYRAFFCVLLFSFHIISLGYVSVIACNSSVLFVCVFVLVVLYYSFPFLWLYHH